MRDAGSTDYGEAEAARDLAPNGLDAERWTLQASAAEPRPPLRAELVEVLEDAGPGALARLVTDLRAKQPQAISVDTLIDIAGDAFWSRDDATAQAVYTLVEGLEPEHCLLDFYLGRLAQRDGDAAGARERYARLLRHAAPSGGARDADVACRETGDWYLDQARESLAEVTAD